MEADFLTVAKDCEAELDFEKFRETQFAKGLTNDQAQSAFDRMDLDKNGSIDLNEWIAGISALECQISLLKNTSPDANLGQPAKNNVQVSGTISFDASSTGMRSLMTGIAQSKSAAAKGQVKIQYKLIDLGTAIAVSDAEGENEITASASMMTFTAMDFAGLHLNDLLCNLHQCRCIYFSSLEVCICFVF